MQISEQLSGVALRRAILAALRCLLLAGLCVSVAASSAASDDEQVSPRPAAESYFEQSVLPILKEHCYECHSHAAEKAKGGLMLDSREGWVQGGDSGPAVVPANPDQSLLIRAVRHDDLKMPPDGRLLPEQIAVLERWVRDGAADPRRLNGTGHASSAGIDAARRHWAFQPIRTVPLPAVNNTDWPSQDLDYFILAGLEAAELRPSADAERFLLLRRVSLDLTGLPPEPETIRSFLADDSPAALARVVDRLLASREFGERWARHWLDLSGYADQIGTANNLFAEHAWRYRDYVIRSFCEDKPFDVFLTEQIAGDLLPAETTEQRAEQLTATGFLLLGDLTVVEADKAKLRVDVADQQVDKIGRAMLGMTLACARCHDHKFDPISQRDYYAVAGMFFATESIRRAEWGVWSWPAFEVLPETAIQQAERHERAAAHQRHLSALREEQQTAEKRRSELSDLLKATTTEESAENQAARQQHEAERSQTEERLKQLAREIEHAEFFQPAAPLAFAVRDRPVPDDMQITIRGNPHALGDKVPRAVPTMIGGGRGGDIPPGESGRRQLAEWIVRDDNPLAARVAVNRVWQKLFGEGIVRSVDYWGVRGQTPDQPELLDYLASEFRSDGWSVKRLIRRIVLSRTYRQGSDHDAAAVAVDPDNRLLWRMNRRRLDAEALRDCMLAAAGTLRTFTAGPSLPLEYPENTGGLGKGGVNPPSFRLARFRPEQTFDRTVYLPVIRSGAQAGPGEIRNVFDFTQPAEFSGQRAVTAVPTQSLFLMNAQFMKERARELATRILSSDIHESSRLEDLWLRVLNRPLTEPERTESELFLRESSAAAIAVAGAEESPDPAGAADPASGIDPGQITAWAELCHALLASNEFLMQR